ANISKTYVKILKYVLRNLKYNATFPKNIRQHVFKNMCQPLKKNTSRLKKTWQDFKKNMARFT
ncbi:hypothetical protein, partial [Bartonella sp. CL48QHWL]|uniref:hypothetical protein n=1 Tax=Bartonella sp. CL48QHWL TaxID=3243535 RepID=UPI0035CFDC3D